MTSQDDRKKEKRTPEENMENTIAVILKAKMLHEMRQVRKDAKLERMGKACSRTRRILPDTRKVKTG